MSIKHVAAAVASVVAFSSAALGVGSVPALAQPYYDETTVVDTPYAPTEAYVPTEAPVYEAPVVEAPVVPAYTPEAPVVTQAPSSPRLPS